MALTKAQKIIAKKNLDYWTKREREQLKHNITEEKEFDRQIEEIYKNMLNNIQAEIDGFYGRYASKEGISIAEAKKKVSSLDIERYERKAKRYVKDKDFSKEANEEMRLYNLTMKVNRLEMLKANIGLELISGADELEKFMAGILQGRTMDELKRQAGILGKTVQNNAQLAKTIPNASFHNATFSQRIWANQTLLKDEIEKLLQVGMIQGKNPRVLAKELRKKFDVGVYNSERLMRTELARVQIAAQTESIKANGFEMYTVHTLGDACPICKPHNGKHYRIDEMVIAKNAPVFHPNCRCSISAYEDSDDYEAWLDWLDSGGTTADWNKMSKEEKAEFKNKPKNDKIKVKNLSDACKALIEGLKTSGVEYNEVEKHSKALKSEEIVNALAGGDLTKGSCASLGLAYIGQKGGLNVLDFRGGKSQNFFSTKWNLRKISELPNVKTFYETARSSVTAGNKLLKKVETGKEYYLCSGRHAAIVRKTEDGILQYLELQSARNSGWQNFDGNPRYTLKYRFGENKGYDVTDFLMEVDSIKDSEDLQELLGYINTVEGEQRKGRHGTIK